MQVESERENANNNNKEGPPFKVQRPRYTVMCHKYRRMIEIVTQITIIVLFIIIVPIIATQYRRYYSSGGRGGFRVYVGGNRGIVGLISIYLVGLFFHYFLEFTGIFFRQLWNFYSRTEFGNLYYSLVNNNNLKFNFKDNKDFMFSEISYAECKDVSKDFMEELNLVNDKLCIINSDLNVIMHEEGEYLYYKNCYDKVKGININARPNPMLDNFKQFLIIGKNDRNYRVLNIVLYIFCIIIGYGELYKLIFNCFAVEKEYSIDKLIFGLNVKVDTFIRTNHPSFLDVENKNQNAAELQELNKDKGNENDVIKI